jgi:hypothetical protein
MSTNDQFKADLAKRLHVNRSTKSFGSAAISLISLPAGATFAPMSGITPGEKAYSSVQVSRDSHIELNSELLYCNHSCDPSLEFDVSKKVVRVAREKELKEGDALTFFYPSTEWDMAQPFDCTCGATKCRKWIAGAGQMSEEALADYWLNDHIVELLQEKNAKSNGHTNGNTNGHSNGHANGHTNGHTNGRSNGHSNGVH